MKINIIIVLGNKLHSPRIHLELKGRLDTALELYNRLLNSQDDTDIVLLLSGGISNTEVPISEAEVMKEYCLKKQIPKDRIILDTKSLDTIGNALFTAMIVSEIQKVTTIYVVSSCYHMSRANYIFNMCYGDKYSLNFDYCYSSDNSKFLRTEEKSLLQAHNFFSGITPGDIKMIKNHLFKNHDLYGN